MLKYKLINVDNMNNVPPLSFLYFVGIKLAPDGFCSNF